MNFFISQVNYCASFMLLQVQKTNHKVGAATGLGQKDWRQERTQRREDDKCLMYSDCVDLLLCFIGSFPVSRSRLDCQSSSRVEGRRQVALGQGYTRGQPAGAGGHNKWPWWNRVSAFY